MGAVYHTLNPRLFIDQIAWIANHGGARALFYDNCGAPIAEAIAPQMRHIEFFFALGEEDAATRLPKKPLAYERFIAGSPAQGWTETGENDACGLCYTSGTTGNPK